MIKTIGFEKEFFVRKDGKFIAAPSTLPADSCGWLLEARGAPHSDPRVAKHLLFAEQERLTKGVVAQGAELVDADTAELPKELQRICRRTHGKGPSKSFFAHGGAYRSDRPRAGLHIHFGYARNIYDSQGHLVTTVQEPANIPRIIWCLDRAFKGEIKASKRIPGEYEMKPHGWEYRSLPSTVDLDKVVQVLELIRDESVYEATLVGRDEAESTIDDDNES